ncbi:MAG TPA: hypothetical protein VIG06_21860 [Kofleriaceae bacterium]
MRCILPFLALAACSTQPAARRPAAAPAVPPTPTAPAPLAAELRAHVSHLAPGDPVVVVIQLAPEAGAVARIGSFEVTLARPDGTTQRARAIFSLTPDRSLGAVVELANIAWDTALDFSLAGRYQLSLAGIAEGSAPRRFTSRAIEIEVMGDGRLPLREIERRARLELARRHPGVPPAPAAVVTEEPVGDRAVRFRAADALYVVRLSPAGAVRGVETEPAP